VPAAAAADYETLLVQNLGTPPHLDLVLLGMGPDAHTASLFPVTIEALDKSKGCVAHYVPKLEAWRMTLTPRTIGRFSERPTAAIGSGSKCSSTCCRMT